MNSSAAALLALRAFRSTSVSGNGNTRALSRTFASTTITKTPTSSTSGGGGSSSTIKADGKNMDPPANVYKDVDKSALGPGASKQSDYKNPEYFSYHRMSYTDMELVMEKHRVPQPSNKK